MFPRWRHTFQIAAKINQPGQGGAGDGIAPGKRPLDADPNNFGEYMVGSYQARAQPKVLGK